MSPQRRCITPGCRNYCVPGRSRCKECGGGAWGRVPASRQIAYIDPLYRRNRKTLLADNPECELRFPGCTGAATTIDHIIAPRLGGTNDLSNLRPACAHCNEARGAAAGRATQKRRAAQRRQR
jgi:5-methylcytosine-specific restriction enzyme A